VVSAVEHPAVLESARTSGWEVRCLPVDAEGLVDPDHMRVLLGPEVAVVSVQAVNHETGVIQAIDRIAGRVRRWAPSAVFHTDAVQAAGWLDPAAATAGADLVTISGHKLGGPQGVGVLAARRPVDLAARIHGGGQERERRSGTHNVAAIVGLAAAVRALVSEGPPEVRSAPVARRRDRLATLVTAGVPGAVQTSVAAARVPGHAHFRIPGVESEELLFLLDRAGVCASAGAACSSGAQEPSPVLLAMGVGRAEARCSLRLTLGPTTSDDDITTAGSAVVEAVARLRGCGG
jgi:cysteine desulfurase